MSKGKTLRASGDFTQAIEGYTAAVRKLSAPLAPGDYPLPEPESEGLVVQKESWDVANQLRTVEWRPGPPPPG
eukprot:COSAG04_NODE_126_length_24619_cov_8.688132_2_plen_73_part_00